MDAWIYIDDQFVGAFEMPCTVPVLYDGSHIVKILPGIKENGISETRIYYPFYDKIEQTIMLTRGQVTTLNPSTTYSQGADFTWMEDFDGAWHSICKTDSSTDSIMTIVTAPDAFEGTGSGKVSITSGTYAGISCNKYVLPKGGSPVFLELNYSCNTDFNVGIIGYLSNNAVDVQWTSLSLRPTSGWNKVYVNLTNEVSQATNSVKFGIFFSMLNNPDLSASYFYLDNVKLVH